MINSKLPSPIEILKNELKTLNFFRVDPSINEVYNNLSLDSDNVYNKFNPLLVKKQLFNFSFESNFSIIFKKVVHYVYFGGLINILDKSNINDISYYFALCGNKKNDNYIMRKFHFDYTVPEKQESYPKPIYHLHYAGKLTPLLKKKGFNDEERIDSHFSEPRLFYTPMSLALLLNLILREFKDPEDDDVTRIMENSFWKSIIIENENLLLKPFFETCSKFFEKRENKTDFKDKLFTTDYYYAN
jgi:hypothetical protein